MHDLAESHAYKQDVQQCESAHSQSRARPPTGHGHRGAGRRRRHRVGCGRVGYHNPRARHRAWPPRRWTPAPARARPPRPTATTSRTATPTPSEARAALARASAASRATGARAPARPAAAAATHTRVLPSPCAPPPHALHALPYLCCHIWRARRRTQRWEAHIWDAKKQVYLGGYDNEDHAGAAPARSRARRASPVLRRAAAPTARVLWHKCGAAGRATWQRSGLLPCAYLGCTPRARSAAAVRPPACVTQPLYWSRHH